MKVITKIIILILILTQASCLKLICDSFPPDNRQPDCNSCRILFIGSSYLDYADNNVVDIFSDFCVAASKDVNIETSVHGGFRLHSHIEYQPTIDKMDSQGWDYVILQGNSAYISKEKWHKYIIPYLSEFRDLIKYNYDKTSVIYMMPWAYLDGLEFIEGETDTYEDMQINIYDNSIKVANNLDVSLAPAGWAWYKTILDNYPAELYLSDFNHQTISGAFLTASVFYSTIFLEQAPEIDIELTEYDNQQLLREIAYNIVINDLDLWNIY